MLTWVDEIEKHVLLKILNNQIAFECLNPPSLKKNKETFEHVKAIFFTNLQSVPLKGCRWRV